MHHRFATVLQLLRGDVRQLHPMVIGTAMSIAVYNIGWGVADPYFAIFLEQFSSDYATIGLYKTIAHVATVLVLVPLGAILDRVRHNDILLFAKIGYGVVGLSYLLAGQLESTQLLVMTLVLHGILLPMIWATAGATLRAYSNKKDAALTFGFYVTLNQLTWASALTIALFVVPQLPIHYIFIPVVAFPLLSTIVGRKFREPKKESLHKALHTVIFRQRVIGSFLQDIRGFNMEMWLMYGLVFAIGTIDVFAHTFLTLYLYDQGYSLFIIGILVLVFTIPFLFSFVAAEIADRSERMRNIILGFGLVAVSIGCLSIWHQELWQVLLAAFCLSVGNAIMLPSISGVITLLTPKQFSGTGSALIEIVLFGSALVSGPLIGLLVDSYNWSTMFLIMGVFYTVLTVVALCFHHYFHRRNLLYHVNKPHGRNEPFIL